jgi:hypothetical protein
MTTTAPEAIGADAASESPGATTATSLVFLDPRALAANPANVRSDLGDLGPLVASIRSIGVLEPLIVIPDGDGGHRSRADHRSLPRPPRPGHRPRHRPGGGHVG